MRAKVSGRVNEDRFLINPDQLAEPFRTQRVGNVFAIGLRFAIEVPLLKASRGSESTQD